MCKMFTHQGNQSIPLPQRVLLFLLGNDIRLNIGQEVITVYLTPCAVAIYIKYSQLFASATLLCETTVHTVHFAHKGAV